MKIIYLFIIGVMAVTLTLSAQAADSYQLGQRLNANAIQRLGQLPVYAVGKQQYRLLPRLSANGSSLLLDAQGTVLGSQNELLITGATENDVQLGVQKDPQPASIQYFSATGITVVRYADFGAAVDGLARLKQRLPQASIHLAIEADLAKPY